MNLFGLLNFVIEFINTLLTTRQNIEYTQFVTPPWMESRNIREGLILTDRVRTEKHGLRE